MSDQALQEFKYSCRIYLSALSIGQLRSYGRNIGVAKSTTMKKDLLIEEIISILSGETAAIARSKKGAPVKNEYVEPEIPKTIENFKIQYLSGVNGEEPIYNTQAKTQVDDDFVQRMAELRKQNKDVLEVSDPLVEKYGMDVIKNGLRRGQLTTLNGVPLLLKLDCSDSEPKIIVPVELIRQNDLREGDIVECITQQSNTALVAKVILTVNGIAAQQLQRETFENCDACYPAGYITLFKDGENNSLTAKYLHWLLPISRGQRGCIVSAPKAGKTMLLYEIAAHAKQWNEKLEVLVLLIDQSPENVTKFRNIVTPGNLVYTTYEDEPERQVFVAKFLLERAKRLAESRKDVLFIVDSLSDLAHAFNATEESVGGKTLNGGVEAKTIQFIKKYFGAARCFIQGGSLTMIGAVSTKTGNPADDFIATELMSIDNYELHLSDDLATKRTYPAIDYIRSQVKQDDNLFNEAENKVQFQIRKRYSSNNDYEELLETLQKSKTYKRFLQNAKIDE